MEERQLRELMCEVGASLWQRQLVGATEGNISCRLDEDRFLCTPSGVSKGHLRPHELLVIDAAANVVTSKGQAPMGFRSAAIEPNLPARSPSSEIKMHLGLYAMRADAMAVVHAHPLVATGLALAGKSLPNDLTPEATFVLGPVALAPFAMPGTDEVPESLRPFAATHNSFLLANHGAVVIGKDLLDALYRMETLERIAQIYLNSQQFGGYRPLSAETVATITEASVPGTLPTLAG